MLRMKKSGEPSHPFGDSRRNDQKSAQASERHNAEPYRIGSRNEHYDKRGGSNQSRCSQIDFAQHKRGRQADDRKRKNKSQEHFAVGFFITCKPGSEKKDYGQFCQ